MSYSSLLEIYSNISKYEISRNYLFDVKFTYPLNNKVAKLFLSIGKDLTFSCFGAELPGRTFSTVDQKIYGVVQKYPALTSYSDITLDFICRDTDFIQRYVFDTWFDIINRSSNPINTSDETNPLFNFEYKNEYTADILITQYSQTGLPIYVIRLIDAFPVNMNPIDLNWGGDGFNKLSISFAYTKWVNEEIPSEEPLDIKYPKEDVNTKQISLMIKESQAKALIHDPFSILGTAASAYKIYKAINNSSPGTSIGMIASVLPGMGISDFTISNVLNNNNNPKGKIIDNLTDINSTSEVVPAKSTFPRV